MIFGFGFRFVVLCLLGLVDVIEFMCFVCLRALYAVWLLVGWCLIAAVLICWVWLLVFNFACCVDCLLEIVVAGFSFSCFCCLDGYFCVVCYIVVLYLASCFRGYCTWCLLDFGLIADVTVMMLFISLLVMNLLLLMLWVDYLDGLVWFGIILFVFV